MQKGTHEMIQSQVVGDFLEAGANVTLSSDVVSGEEAYRSNPFIGIEMSMTRREYGTTDEAPPLSPASAAISLEHALEAYTINGARQLDREAELGSLVSGKLADFIVLDSNPFDVDRNRIHQVTPVATVIGGQVVFGSLGK